MASLKIALAIDAENPNVGDIYLHNNAASMTATLSEEVAQQLYIRFRMFQGEWFLDPTIGVPYWQSILGQKTGRDVIAQIFRKVVTTCPGVASLQNFNLVFDSKARAMSLGFACTLADGTTLLSSDFGPFVIGGV